MTKFFIIAFVLCAIYVSVESKPLILDKLQDTLSGVTCTVTGLIGKCTQQPEQSVNTINGGGAPVIGAPDTADERRVIQAGTCQAGYRMDRTGTCRKVA